MNQTMNAREFFYLTSRVRAAQKEYFRTRNQIDLRRARALEGELDNVIAIAKELMREQELRAAQTNE